jgi:hypothetical protein
MTFRFFRVRVFRRRACTFQKKAPTTGRAGGKARRLLTIVHPEEQPQHGPLFA